MAPGLTGTAAAAATAEEASGAANDPSATLRLEQESYSCISQALGAVSSDWWPPPPPPPLQLGKGTPLCLFHESRVKGRAGPDHQ